MCQNAKLELLNIFFLAGYNANISLLPHWPCLYRLNSSVAHRHSKQLAAGLEKHLGQQPRRPSTPPASHQAARTSFPHPIALKLPNPKSCIDSMFNIHGFAMNAKKKGHRMCQNAKLEKY